MNALCSECKCCEAQPSMAADPKPLCIFCEDGVACPGRQKAARAVVTAAPSRLLTPPAATVRKPRNPKSPWRGFATLRGNAPANSQMKPTPTDGGVDLQDEAAEPQQIEEVSTAGHDRQEDKESKTMRLSDEERSLRKVCPCGTLLRKDNSDGLCKVCRKAAKTDAAVNKPSAKRGRPRKSKATPPTNSTSRVPPTNGTAMIRVTEENLNSFWMKLSLEEKAVLFQRQLEGA
jgi:hypothetical protein